MAVFTILGLVSLVLGVWLFTFGLNYMGLELWSMFTVLILLLGGVFFLLLAGTLIPVLKIALGGFILFIVIIVSKHLWSKYSAMEEKKQQERERQQRENERLQQENERQQEIEQIKVEIRKSDKYRLLINFIKAHSKLIYSVSVQNYVAVGYCDPPAPLFVQDYANQKWVRSDSPLRNNSFLKIGKGERNWTPKELVAISQLTAEAIKEYIEPTFTYSNDIGAEFHWKASAPTTEIVAARPY